MIHYVDKFPGRKIKVRNLDYLYFGGTAYLGLQSDAYFQKLLIDNIKKYGTNYGASRISNVRLSIFEKSESYLAKLVGSEACISLSSGYLAGQFTRNYFNYKFFKRFFAPNAHSALLLTNDACQETYSSLKLALEEHLEAQEKTVAVVFLDSIDFSGSNYPDFNPLKSLPLANAILVVDDSHGIGIVGEHGEGVFKMLMSLGAREVVVCCSLGKGFSIQAGAIFGTVDRINAMTETSFYGGASPATPANMATLMDSQELMSQKRKKLKKRMHQFKEGLTEKFPHIIMDGHPTISFFNKGLTDYLEDKKVIVTNFPYPNEDSQTMSRIVISACHKKKDIQKLTRHIQEYFSDQI